MAFQRTVHFRADANTAVTASATATTIEFGGISPDVRIGNGTGQILYVAIGASGVVATAANMLIPVGGVAFFRREPHIDTHVSVITATGTGAVSVSEGEGGS